ncbi:sulfotransferase [Actinoplanes teichomyceticus]|uniref:Sulfotransferase family protein n=1 Tax=Actinoplanes teichomyceticus TaxID=1867 RepID=A0A561VQ94_ACTTI|nr:sulfotransferase [Actinoplanes teichomyceticus]TWG13788.1 sulfotransferase family protein [Actinoplanes teichomyceticus]GIF12386.1 sulfotransferase [Actinoplanes teichomyceticus]
MAQVLFLGGLGRSGTTLVERLLGELPGICALGEVVHLWQRDLRDDERCGCGSRFSGCTFWQRVGERAFGGWANVDVDRVHTLRDGVERTRHIPRLASAAQPAAQVREYASYYSRVYAAAAEVSGAKLVVDSSKHSALAHVLRAAGDIDLRVVHVVRDARGVAYSWTKRVARPETDGADEMTRYSPGRSALLWNAHNAAFGLLARRGVPVRRIRYEEFLADPRAAIIRLADFAGLAPRPEDLEFLRPGYADLRVGHSAAGNPMRFTVGRLPLRHDDAWMRALPPAQRRLVGAMCGPMLRAYGYPLNPQEAR